MKTIICVSFCTITAALMLFMTHSAFAAEGPYGGNPAPIPGTVQAENYDTGGQGVAYNVTSVNGTGNSYRSDAVDLELVTHFPAEKQWTRHSIRTALYGRRTKCSSLLITPQHHSSP